MSDIDVRRQALRELAKEKVRLQDEASSEPSLGEDKAGQQQTKEVQEEGMSFKQASPEKIILAGRREDDSAFGWTQFAPWKKEKKKKPKSMNTATIWCMARREIAREWRMARGVTERDPRRDALEREAVMWRERREEVRLKAEEIRARFEKQKVKVDGALKIIGQKMLEEKGNLTAEGAIALIEDAFGAIGKIYNIDWREDGCNIWLEPWEERWSRSKEDELPVIYNLKINDRLEVVSIDAVEDEQSIAEQQAVLLERELKTGESLDEGPPGADEEDIKTRLEKKIAKAGRLIELKKWKEDAWVATVEPWEDMRLRNIERNGQGPIETETIVAKVVDGDLIMAPVKPELGTAQRPTGVPNSTERGRPKGVLRSEASPKGDDANVQKEGGEDAS